MTIGRSICRIAIYGGICLAASSASLLIEAAGFSFLKMLAGAIASVVAGNTANAIDNFDLSRPDYVGLQNEDLIRVSGKAIAQIIFLASQNSKYDRPTRKRLKIIAAKATEAWVELARREFGRSNYQELTEGEIPLIITPTEAGLTQAEILQPEEWVDIVVKLDIKIDPNQGVDLELDVRQDVAKLLQNQFPKILREALKQDFKQDGKAFAGLMIQLLTGIRQQLDQQGETAMIFLNKLSTLEQQFTGSEQQIQQVFVEISDKMQTGYEQLCHKFDFVETNINKNLQSLQDILMEKLDEQSQKLDDIRNVIQPRETREKKLVKALLNLDYDKQVNLFKDLLKTHQIGACLIHGYSDSLPRWLLHRLIRNVPKGNTSTCVKIIQLSRRNHRNSLNSIFEEISHQFKIESTSSVPAIHQKILEVWQSQTVILILKITQNIEESHVEVFLQEFWQPLAQLASQNGTTNDNYSLLLFFLDEDGETNDWNITCTEKLTPNLIPHTLIKFMEIQPIERRELSIWIDLYCCAENLLKYTDSLVDEVFKDSKNGVHKYIFDNICSLCQTTWEDCTSEWLKY